MLVKEEGVAVAGDDGGDDDDARSCDSIRWGECLCGCVVCWCVGVWCWCCVGLVVVEGGVWCGG